MPKSEHQIADAINSMNQRLLQAEGQVLVLRTVLRNLITYLVAQQIFDREKIDVHLDNLIEELLDPQYNHNEPTKVYFQAAAETVKYLKTIPDEGFKPVVVQGGKVDDPSLT